MSALDQVFIKAFQKETGDTVCASDGNSTTWAPAAPELVEHGSVLVEGAWRRIEREPADGPASPVPEPHVEFGRTADAAKYPLVNVRGEEAPAGEVTAKKTATGNWDNLPTSPQAQTEPQFDSHQAEPPPGAGSDDYVYGAEIGAPPPSNYEAAGLAPALGVFPEVGACQLVEWTDELSIYGVGALPEVAESYETPQPVNQPQQAVSEATPTADEEPATAAEAETSQPAAVASSDAESEPPQFAAEWEVDQFQWPSVCHELLLADRQYFQVAGQRLREAAADGLHVLGITSASRGAGKTSLALCLAKCAAEVGMRVALVDADVDNPQLALRLGLGVASGWEDANERRQSLAECAVQSIEDGIVVAPIADADRARTRQARLTSVLSDATRVFDLVIVDMGAAGAGWLNAEEKLPLDAAIVVRDLRADDDEQWRHAVQQLKQANIEAVGVAENFGPRTSAGKAA